MFKMYAESLFNRTNKTLNNNRGLDGGGSDTEIQALLFQFWFFIDVASGKANANFNSSMTFALFV